MNTLNTIKKYSDLIFGSFIKKYKDVRLAIKRDSGAESLINSIKLSIRNIESIDFKNIDTGWNSSNNHIATPSNKIVEDVGDLDKFCSKLHKLNNERPYSAFLDNAFNKVSVTKYFLSKNNETVNVEDYVKKIVAYTKVILAYYIKELDEPESNNQFKLMIINQILTNIKITLESLSSMK